MNSGPKVSVVITCYNYGRYIDFCLRSVLSQTYNNYEILVIDDGSTDNTRDCMLRYSDFPNIKYVYQENKGQAKAKNNGIQHATGEYIAFLDADDLWVKDKLEKQIRLFENSRVGVVYSRAYHIDDIGLRLRRDPLIKYLTPRSGKVTNWLFLDNFVYFSSSIVRNQCFEDFGVFDESLQMGIDWDLWLRVSTKYDFDFVDEELLGYRVGHTGQMSKNLSVRQACSDQIMKKFLNLYPDAVDHETVDLAYSYTFSNRGHYYMTSDTSKAFHYFVKSIRLNFYNISAYKGIVKLFLRLLAFPFRSSV